MKRRFVYLWIGIGLFVLFVFLYLPGLSRLQELRLEEERLGRELTALDRQIQRLQEEKQLLQNDVSYLEKVVREELGLVKPGEMVYKLVPAKEAPEPERV
jgi:cell division protein FtsB